MKGNIVGEGFDNYVKDQINIRQKRLGEVFRSNETVLVENSNTSWVRLASSVNLTDDDNQIKNILGENLSQYKGNKLAKEFVLFNGISKYDGTSTSGIANNLGFNLNSSYGFMGLPNGLSPVPGIESVDITSYNRGSLRKANIKLKAWNPLQFYIIDILYMRVGFTILLEWGHSLYFNNDNNFEKETTFITKPYEQLFKATPTTPSSGGTAGNVAIQGAESGVKGAVSIDQYTILDSIENERENRSGNYDGFFGKITSFNWSLSPNGSYDINVTAISIGDVIESLKINVALEGKLASTSTNNSSSTIIPNSDKNLISKWLEGLIVNSQKAISQEKIQQQQRQSGIGTNVGPVGQLSQRGAGGGI